MGAVALVLAAVIVLPMVFDREPERPGLPVSVRIPGEDDTPFTPKAIAEQSKVQKKPAAPAGEQFVVPVGAYANPRSVLAKLAGAKLPYFTEQVSTANGKVTRVRAGPFASRSEAEKAAEKLKSLGLRPGTVTAKSG